MLESTKAIVLNTIKYGEADLIAKCYTQAGLKSYMLKGILKSRKGKLKAAYFQPLTLLEIVANHNTKGNLNFIKEAKVSYPYRSIPFDVSKQTVVLFLAEVLSKAIHEEEINTSLFQFLETSLIWLDTNDSSSNFHLLFLINLTKPLGFYPEIEQINKAFFDLQEGRFIDAIPHNEIISGINLTHLKALLGTNFDALNELKFSRSHRQALLDILIRYFELHLPGFYEPKSLAILKTVFK